MADSDDHAQWPAKAAALTHALAALLQTAALEVHVDAVAGQRLHVRRLLDIAFSRASGSSADAHDNGMAGRTTVHCIGLVAPMLLTPVSGRCPLNAHQTGQRVRRTHRRASWWTSSLLSASTRRRPSSCTSARCVLVLVLSLETQS